MHYVVIDTNVLVSSLLAEHNKNNKSKPFMVMNNLFYTDNNIIPLYNQDILDEYKDVLSRPIFGFSKLRIGKMINDFKKRALCIDEKLSKDIIEKIEKFKFPDEDDIVFYQVSLSRKPSYLVTGNISHFPVKPFVVTPSEYLEILKGRKITEIRQENNISTKERK